MSVFSNDQSDVDEMRDWLAAMRSQLIAGLFGLGLLALGVGVPRAVVATVAVGLLMALQIGRRSLERVALLVFVVGLIVWVQIPLVKAAVAALERALS